MVESELSLPLLASRTPASKFCEQNFAGVLISASPGKKYDDQLVVIFLGGGGEIRTPAAGLPTLTI